MTDTVHLLHRITQELHSMSAAEGRVAKVILDAPEEATSSSIAQLAIKASVSEPSVNRFCKKYGASGFPDFKLKLAKALVSGVPYLSKSVAPGDDVEAYTRKIFDSTLGSLFLVRDSLDVSVLERVVDQLIIARRIHFFGLGASSAVAKDAEHKFFRFNLPVSFHEDMLMQRMLASAGGADDLFFIISYTGRTTAMVETAKLAVENGSTVVGMTAPDSPLAKVCQLVVEVDVPEDTDFYMPMTSRLVQLVLLDVLATGVTLRRGPKFEGHLRKIKESLKTTRQAK